MQVFRFMKVVQSMLTQVDNIFQFIINIAVHVSTRNSFMFQVGGHLDYANQLDAILRVVGVRVRDDVINK